MTLTAMMGSGRLVNPSAEVAEGSNWETVARRIRDLQNDEGLYCPHCHQALAQLAPVRLRAGSARILHFFHLHLEGEQRECKSFSGESEKHMSAKTRLYEHLQRINPLQIQSIALDSTVLKTEGTSDRKPDVLVIYKNGSRVAHEIQISPISSTNLLERSHDLRQHGCTVLWYLYAPACTRENRAALSSEGIECYRLVFEDSNPALPVWTPDLGLEPERPSQRQPVRDRCGALESKERVRREDLRAERYKRSLEHHPQDALSVEDEPFEDIEYQVTHSRKPVWIGKVYDYPWLLPDHLDILWHTAPLEAESGKPMSLLDQPQRYPIKDLLMGGAPVLNRDGGQAYAA